MRYTGIARHLAAGVAGAATVSFALGLCFAFGLSFTQYAVVWLIYSSVPILVGGLGGLLVGWFMRNIRYLWTFCLAGFSTVMGEFLGVIYISEPLMEVYTGRYRLFGMLGPIVVGVSIEMVLFGIMFVLYKLRGRQGT